MTVEYKESSAEDNAYTTEKPSTVGQYIVRVTVAADDDYNEAERDSGFAITYLAAPEPAYTLSGDEGQNGWYISRRDQLRRRTAIPFQML